ncbi:hypothetical protein QUF50_01600 [Thiotrichales bacterium HSG1]|nr:hypothetical protein [Thiotrichales bacterium HSG1]
MIKMKIVTFISLFIVFNPVMAISNYIANFNSVKQTIDACLPVRPLPPLLTIADIDVLNKGSGPQWCRLLRQMGYIWPKTQNSMSSSKNQMMVKNGRRIAERTAEQCLARSPARLHVIMKRRLVAYVGYQYECDRLRSPKVCQMAKDIALDFLYGYPNEIAVKTRSALEKLMVKAKECDGKSSMQEYCEKLGITDSVCMEL